MRMLFMSLMISSFLLIAASPPIPFDQSSPDNPFNSNPNLRQPEMMQAVQTTNPITSNGLYRLPSDLCQQKGYCYARLSSSLLPNPTQAGNYSLVCGMYVYTIGGYYAGNLSQRVNADFHVIAGRSPVTFNYGTRAGTHTTFFIKISDLSGPSAYPGWGTYATGKATSTFEGVFNGPCLTTAACSTSLNVTTIITVSPGGWSCRAYDFR